MMVRSQVGKEWRENPERLGSLCKSDFQNPSGFFP